MKIKFDASAPSTIAVLMNPGDELEVNPELGERLLATSPQLRAEATKPQPRPPAEKPAKKGKGKVK